MDFFSILLPGALLTALLMGKVCPVVLGGICIPSSPTRIQATFLLASHLSGHLIYLLYSFEFCNLARRYVLNTQIATLAPRPPAALAARTMIWPLFKAECNLCIDQALSCTAHKCEVRFLKQLQAEIGL